MPLMPPKTKLAKLMAIMLWCKLTPLFHRPLNKGYCLNVWIVWLMRSRLTQSYILTTLRRTMDLWCLSTTKKARTKAKVNSKLTVAPRWLIPFLASRDHLIPYSTDHRDLLMRVLRRAKGIELKMLWRMMAWSKPNLHSQLWTLLIYF